MKQFENITFVIEKKKEHRAISKKFRRKSRV